MVLASLLGRHLLQLCMLALKQARGGFLQIQQQMEAICHLNCMGRAFSGSLGVVPRTVSSDHLDPRVTLEPGCERLRFAIGLDVHDVMPFQINQHTAVGLPFAYGPIIDAKDTWRRCNRHGTTAKQA
jgi:hypothetical protein